MVVVDFSMNRGEDLALGFSMAPPAPIGGRDILFRVGKGFGGVSGLLQASVSSGYSGLSGITITDSGLGRMTIQIPSLATSGLDPGNYTYGIRMVDYPVTELSQGHMTLYPA